MQDSSDTLRCKALRRHSWSCGSVCSVPSPFGHAYSTRKTILTCTEAAEYCRSGVDRCGMEASEAHIWSTHGVLHRDFGTSTGDQDGAEHWLQSVFSFCLLHIQKCKTKRGTSSSRSVAAKYFVLFDFFVSFCFPFVCVFLCLSLPLFFCGQLSRDGVQSPMTRLETGSSFTFTHRCGTRAVMHRSVQSLCDLDMPAQRGKSGRRARWLWSNRGGWFITYDKLS